MLRTNEDADPSRLSIRFAGVRDLVVKDVSPGAWCTLTIEDISDRGWEDVNYLVSDVEDEVIRFSCGSFSVDG